MVSISLNPPTFDFVLNPAQTTISGYISMTLAGWVAETILAGEKPVLQEDVTDVTKFLEALGYDEDTVAEQIKIHIGIVKAQVKIHRDEILEIAEKLDEVGTLTADDLGWPG
jgi:hypothetical protein